MYLRRLELQGFKTFAQKTSLEFLLDAGGRRGLTSVVGPNGSGKSNIADALRWVMGEQSLKLLRGKKSEDVIFSGSERRSRSGFAEVTMTLVNDDKPDIDLPEITITRRLYRDGQSEYEVNKKSARLTDVVMLLAQAGIGQRTYSVIGQGMVDSILSASPSERKEFFEEAAGLRPFQLKRQAAMNKLQATHENVKQAEILLREIGPRLSTLERQAKRLQEREGLQQELHELERAYYGGVWAHLRDALTVARTAAKAADADKAACHAETEKIEAELAAMEKALPPSQGFREIQKAIDDLVRQRAELREQQLRFEASREVAEARAEKPWSPLPLSKIIESIEHLHAKHEALWKALSEKDVDVARVRKVVEELRASNEELLSKLQRPAPEPEQPVHDATSADDLKRFTDQMFALDANIAEAQSRVEAWNKNEEGKRVHLFELQHQLAAVRRKLEAAEHRASDAAVQVAKGETRHEAFIQDVRAHAATLEAELDALADAWGADKRQEDPESFAPRVQRLRSQLEWIGGIDPEVLKEYETTKKRFDELATQSEDLKQAMTSLDTIIAELDQTIRERAETSFRLLDREFGLFFKKLFGGGEAKLLEVAPEPEVDEDGNVIEDVDANAGPAGIEIQATPPGKRLKSVALLSGGERALTSIALICAIMATNPSPFVALDEVDAALDESNSRKFAEIIGSLADKTQFVVITHNRATMHQAHVLYGVTMGDDGVSQLLSVKLEDVVGKG